jgi:hypothetical protein
VANEIFSFELVMFFLIIVRPVDVEIRRLAPGAGLSMFTYSSVVTGLGYITVAGFLAIALFVAILVVCRESLSKILMRILVLLPPG